MSRRGRRRRCCSGCILEDINLLGMLYHSPCDNNIAAADIVSVGLVNVMLRGAYLLELVSLEPTDVGNIKTIDMKLDTVFGSLKLASEYYYTVVQMMITGGTFANETRTGSAYLNAAGNLIIAFPENALTGVTVFTAINGSFALNVLGQT